MLGWVTVVALLGETLGLSRGVRRTSPFELVGRLPVDRFSPGAVAGLVAAVAVLAALGHLAITRRDLAA